VHHGRTLRVVPTIAVEGLEKSYGAVRAVDGLSFTVEAGEVFALLGPNGAGKTTTVEILTGHRRRSGGQVTVLGFDPATGGRAYRERIGVVLQSAGFEEEFTVRELVRLQSRLYPRGHRPDEVIDLVGLTDKRGARVKTLSGGQRRRLDLALGLVGAPNLLFLDEPTTGFDPSARHHAWDLVASLRDTGTTILLTTHYMDEAQHLADRAAVVCDGRLVALGRPTTSVPDGASTPSRSGCRLLCPLWTCPRWTERSQWTVVWSRSVRRCRCGTSILCRAGRSTGASRWPASP
jgi:ABC-2 type transport system ATP-binding protein